MIVFHGSYTAVDRPMVEQGRLRVDFGRGFYLTGLREQAETWAVAVSRRHRGGVPILNVFDLDLDRALALAGSRQRKFAVYDLGWLDYVVDCRCGGQLQSQYDIVEGGVANDNVIDTVELYESGVITAEQALGLLAHKKVNHQIAILSQRIIDDCLRYLGSEEVRDA